MTIMDIPFKRDFTYFHSARPPVIPELEIIFHELQNAIHDISQLMCFML